MTKKQPETGVSDRFVGRVCGRLRDNKPVRRTLTPWGRVHVDRQLPFLCVYRRTERLKQLPMQHLVTSEAAYLYADADKKRHAGLSKLTAGIIDVMVEQFGAFMLLEIWPGPCGDLAEDNDDVASAARPRFRVVKQRGQELGAMLDKMVESLARIRIGTQSALVDSVEQPRVAPPGLRPLLAAAEALQRKCVVVGLEMLPVFFDAATGEVFPQMQRQLERSLAVALKRTFFEFARTRTTHRPPHYHALGRHATVQAVWRADRMLSQVSDGFDFLLQVSPINAGTAWQSFQKLRYRRAPSFYYRPLAVDPIALKRRLFQTPTDRVEDPAIGQLLRDKVNELDRQITMLLDINTSRFLHGSIQVYGGVEAPLLELAEQMLERMPRESKAKPPGSLDATAFAKRAEREIEYLRQQDKRVTAKVQVRDDVIGLVVSHGSLLIGAETSVPPQRVDALLQHEIGTHVLTYYNGRAQPFRQLYSGLSGYEALQEGIAVLAEFLVGGLSRGRLRLLAARVVAVEMLESGAGFVQCFQRLVDQYGFEPRTAFNIVTRVFRGGGLTKDAIYLRGLVQTFTYLGKGGRLEPLFVGKISAEHIPLVRELQWRHVLTEPRLKPRYMTQPDALARLERARAGMTVLDIIELSGSGSRRPRRQRPQTAAI